jgi:hypothetical protein
MEMYAWFSNWFATSFGVRRIRQDLIWEIYRTIVSKCHLWEMKSLIN